LVSLQSPRYHQFYFFALLLIPAALAIWFAMVGQPNFEGPDGDNGSYNRLMNDSPICTRHCDHGDHQEQAAVQPVATSEPTPDVIVQPTSNRNANLRAGPGTEYPIVGQVIAGQVLQLVGKSPGSQWYRLESGQWIAAFLVDNAPDLPFYTGLTTNASSPSNSQPQSSQPTANRSANLRAGPGYSYRIIGHARNGQPLQLVAKNVDGRWLRLDSGAWIAAFLVDNAPDLPAVTGTGG